MSGEGEGLCAGRLKGEACVRRLRKKKIKREGFGAVFGLRENEKSPGGAGERKGNRDGGPNGSSLVCLWQGKRGKDGAGLDGVWLRG